MADPFATLNLPASFEIDPAALEKQYLVAASACHPDQFSDPLEQADAAEKAAEINRAYHLLKHPLSRAEALLKNAWDCDGAEDVELPADFLMDMLEKREALQEAAASGDQGELNALARFAAEQRDQVLANFARLVSEHQADPSAEASPTVLKQARLELAKARYFQRMHDSALG